MAGRVYCLLTFFAQDKVLLVALQLEGDLVQIAQDTSVGINVFMSTRSLRAEK